MENTFYICIANTHKGMKRDQLKKEFRQALAENWSLRCAIGLDIAAHQQTLQRWAVNNSPKLCTAHFLAAFRKRAGIEKSVELTEQVAINQSSLA